VRSDEEVNAMLAIKTITGGIKVDNNKDASKQSLASEQGERDPAVSNKS
jgi:geranylgeranyl reductase